MFQRNENFVGKINIEEKAPLLIEKFLFRKKEFVYLKDSNDIKLLNYPIY